MKFSKMTTLMMAAGLSAVVALAGCGGSGGAKQQYLNIGTGGTAGTYYPLGGAMAELFNKNIANVNASAQSTGASVANVNMLKDGSLDLALIQNDIAYYAANGLEMFDGKKVDNLRGIATLYPETVQIVGKIRHQIDQRLARQTRSGRRGRFRHGSERAANFERRRH